MFNIVIICPAASVHKVQKKILSVGAAQNQTGFIAKRTAVSNSRGKCLCL